MKPTTDNLPAGVLDPMQQPEPAKLLETVKAALNNTVGQGFLARMELNAQTRSCEWTGQTPDCRKHAPRGVTNRKLVRPWENASDARVKLAEQTLNENVLVMKAALRRAHMSVGTFSLDPSAEQAGKAGTWDKVAAYYLTLMEAEIITEGDRLANIQQEFGHAVLNVEWRESQRLDRRSMRATQLMTTVAQAVAADYEAAVQAAESGQGPAPALTLEETLADLGAAMEAMITDPDQRGRLVELIKQIDPDLADDEAVRVARQLGSRSASASESVEYWVPFTFESRPSWRALTPFVDVFYPPETLRLADAPWIATVEWLSKIALEERVHSHSWSKEWVDQVTATPAQGLSSFTGSTIPNWTLAAAGVGLGWTPSTSLPGEGLWPVIHFWQVATSKTGVPCTYRTVLNWNVNTSYGAHEAQPHAHGKLPFVETRREQRSVLLIGSRGVPELAIGEQAQTKLLIDGHADRAELAVNPPLRVPMNQTGGKINVAPGVQIPTPRTGVTDVVSYMDPPDYDPGSVKVLDFVRDLHDGYWHRGKNTDPEIKLLYRQTLADDWLKDMRDAYLMTFQLVQEFTPPLKVQRIAGVDVNLEATREQIQGDLDLKLTFDAADIDKELVVKRLEAIAKLLVPLDTEGVIDRGGLVALTFRLLNPDWARLVRPAEQVSQEEVDDEDVALAKIAAGIEPPFKLGKNHRLRLDRLRGNVAANPQLQQRLQTDQIFAALLQSRMEKHQHQLDQEANKRIGLEGGADVLVR